MKNCKICYYRTQFSNQPNAFLQVLPPVVKFGVGCGGPASGGGKLKRCLNTILLPLKLSHFQTQRNHENARVRHIISDGNNVIKFIDGRSQM